MKTEGQSSPSPQYGHIAGSTKEMEEKEKVSSFPFWSLRSARFRVTITLLMAVMANSFVRNTLSMGMVCMVNTTAIRESSPSINHTTMTTTTRPKDSDSKCTLAEKNVTGYDGPLVWNSEEQGFLFSAMYWGGVISGLPAGYLADRYNPKIIITICLIINLAGCALTPITAVAGGLVPVFVLRLLMGIGGQATIYPSVAAIAARWIPPNERSTVIALYTTGTQVATIIGSPLNAFLCSQKNFLGGWPAIFYVTSFFTVPTIILWWIFVATSPDNTRLITTKERKYIKRALMKQNVNKKKATWKEVPWMKMLTSMPVVVSVLGNFTLSAMNTTLTSYIPTYFKESLKMDLSSNGALGTLPFISQWVGKFVSATIADQLKTRTKISRTWICKIFNSIGSFSVAGFMIACAYMDCTEAMLAVAFMTIANGLFSCQAPGFMTSLACIAPLYSGMIQAMSRFVGQIASVIAPYVVGAIVTDGTSAQWRIVFLAISILMIAGGLSFLIFGSAEIQEWAKSKPESLAVIPATEQITNGDCNQKCNDEYPDDTSVMKL